MPDATFCSFEPDIWQTTILWAATEDATTVCDQQAIYESTHPVRPRKSDLRAVGSSSNAARNRQVRNEPSKATMIQPAVAGPHQPMEVAATKPAAARTTTCRRKSQQRGLPLSDSATWCYFSRKVRSLIFELFLPFLSYSSYKPPKQKF